MSLSQKCLSVNSSKTYIKQKICWYLIYIFFSPIYAVVLSSNSMQTSFYDFLHQYLSIQPLFILFVQSWFVNQKTTNRKLRSTFWNFGLKKTKLFLMIFLLFMQASICGKDTIEHGQVRICHNPKILSFFCCNS